MGQVGGVVTERGNDGVQPVTRARMPVSACARLPPAAFSRRAKTAHPHVHPPLPAEAPPTPGVQPVHKDGVRLIQVPVVERDDRTDGVFQDACVAAITTWQAAKAKAVAVCGEDTRVSVPLMVALLHAFTGAEKWHIVRGLCVRRPLWCWWRWKLPWATSSKIKDPHAALD